MTHNALTASALSESVRQLLPVATIADLKAIDAPDETKLICVLGKTTKGSGQDWFYFDTTSSATDDSSNAAGLVTVVQPTSSTGAGRWLRVRPQNLSLTQLATQSANTVLANATSGSAPPTAVQITDALVDASAAIESSKLSFTQSGTGAVATDLQTAIRRLFSVNVLDYGGDKTGATSSATAFNNATTAANGRFVYAPAGTYRIDSTISLERIIGDGEDKTILKKGANVVLATFFTNRWACEGVYFSGNNDNNQSVLTAFSDTTDLVQIGRNDGANGQSVVGGYINASNGRMRNVAVFGSGRDGITWQEGQAIAFENVRSQLNTRRGVNVSSLAFDASLGSGTIHTAYNGEDGIHVEWGTHSFQMLVSFSNTGKGIYFNNGTGLFCNAFAESNTGVGLYLDTAQSNSFVNLLHADSETDFTDAGSRNVVVYKNIEYGLAITGNVFDASGFSGQTISATDEHDYWILSDGITVTLGTPASNKIQTFFKNGSGSACSLTGTIVGGTVTLYTKGDSVKVMYSLALSSWIVLPRPLVVGLPSGADAGDADKTLTAKTDNTTQRWNTVITADRAVTLSTTNASNGDKFRIIRGTAATGAFNLNVGTGPLKALAAGQWCDVEYNGAAWILAAFGSL